MCGGGGGGRGGVKIKDKIVLLRFDWDISCYLFNFFAIKFVGDSIILFVTWFGLLAKVT